MLAHHLGEYRDHHQRAYDAGWGTMEFDDLMQIARYHWRLVEYYRNETTVYVPKVN